MINVVVVTARCRSTKQGFGIRVEERLPRQWVADWAFALKEAVARKEGYDRSEIRGTFTLDNAYPGCPHCRAKGFVRCSCGKVGCWDSESTMFICPWCGGTGRVQGQIETLTGGGDA